MNYYASDWFDALDSFCACGNKKVIPLSSVFPLVFLLWALMTNWLEMEINRPQRSKPPDIERNNSPVCGKENQR